MINFIFKIVYGYFVLIDCIGDGYVIFLYFIFFEIIVIIFGLVFVCLVVMVDLVEYFFCFYFWYFDLVVVGLVRVELGFVISEILVWVMVLVDCVERERGKEMKLDGVVRGVYEWDVSVGDRFWVGKG